MDFTLPSDFNIKTIKKLWSIKKKYSNANIVEVYGNLLNYMSIGSGRGYLPVKNMNVNLEKLHEYVLFINELGIKFNYTINASCTSNVELNKNSQRDIIKHIDKLLNIGVKNYTVASVSLLRFLHYIYKEDINITLSTISNVNSTCRAISAEKLGANTIVIGEDETRNIELIRNIRSVTKCRLEIIVNSMCTWNCIYRNSHYNCLAHMQKEDGLDVQFFTNQCEDFRHKNPVEEIKTPWIRPEDLSKYEQIGVNLFKIIGREIMDIADWPKMMDVYFKGEFDGNLLELNHGFSGTAERQLDNRSLDGFIDYFFNSSYQCFRMCDTGKCNYCNKYLEKAYRQNEKK